MRDRSSNPALNRTAQQLRRWVPAARRAIGAADYHPLSVRRFAPAITRLQRTVVPASTLARPPAADPQLRQVL